MSRFPISSLSMILIVAGLTVGGNVCAQCIIANPSFEFSGSGGPVFAGWNQFGPVGSSANATHGAVAARVSGPNLGGWDVAAFWQRLDAVPGDRWTAAVSGWHGAGKPLTGQSKAILNIEWRDAGGGLISYESHTVADAGTPPNEVVEFSVTSQPAPPGAVATHLLLGVLQGPTDPVPDVFYDQATFDNLGPPSVDEIQWDDFPGGRAINFSGRSWRVKGPGVYGPGPNLFNDTATGAWVDGIGHLHMTIRSIGGLWYSTEITLEEALGYGDYVFTTLGRLDTLHPNAVLGLFLWEYRSCYDPANRWWGPYNEIDVEFSRWGNPANDVGQFVVQPYDFPGNLSRFAAAFSDGELTSHAFLWLPDRVEYRSWRGGPQSESPATTISEWTYTGPHTPRPEQPRVHINLWQFSGPPNSDQEVVLTAFTFVPDGSVVGVPEDEPRTLVAGHLSPAVPNPFGPRTTIGYTLERDGHAEVAIYDVAGRLVRTLLRRFVPAGDHEVVWNGRDEAGKRVASGIYLYRLRAGDAVETRRMMLMR